MVSTDSVSLKDLYSVNYLRKALIIACLIQYASSFSGVINISYFSTKLLVKTGVEESIAGFANQVGEIVQY